MIPEGLQPLLDGDIIRYEIAFAAETGWKAITGRDELPSFEYVEKLLLDRISTIKNNCLTDKEPIIYITEGKTFRYDVAKRKPYKGQRHADKPWHYDNLTIYLRDVLGAKVVMGIEADDQLAIDHVASIGTTVLVSRDKDLMQVPGYFYKWELGSMASWGPDLITQEGGLTLGNKNKLIGTGLSWLYAQMLVGDTADNIPGCPGVGPVRAFEILRGRNPEEMLSAVINEYQMVYGENWEQEMLEQGRLVFLIRKLHPDGSPVMYEIGMVD